MEGNSFPSPTEKSPGATESPPGFGSRNIGNTQNEHPQPHAPPSVPAATVLFRILCLATEAGALIGKSGIAIQQLRNSTESKIFVEKNQLGSPYRIITITAELGATAWVKLGVNNARKREEEEQVEVSRAQYALIRVFEALNGRFGTGMVWCRLLMKASNVGAVKGNGGELVERIMKETGCKVEIRTDDLPICASRDDALVEIEGYALAVKKALVSISSLLQACQMAKMVVASASKNHPVTIKQTLEDASQELVLKILCPTGIVGLVIGPKSAKIKALQDETGASIYVGNTFPDCDERLIVITASENLKDQSSPTKEAIVLVFTSIYESATGGSRSSITARLVLPANQIGCLLGKEGRIVSEMQRETGASSIQVLKAEQNPKCVSENDLIMEISGEFQNVKKAIYEVAGRLRCNLLMTNPSPSHSLTMHKRSEDFFQKGSHYSKPVAADRLIPTAGYADRQFTMGSNQMWASPPPITPGGLYDGSGGLSSRMSDLRLGSGCKSAIVTNTTVEVRVLESAINFHSLQRVRQISGASIIVREPHLRTSDRNRILAISGTLDQIQVAQNLLQNFYPHG